MIRNGASYLIQWARYVEGTPFAWGTVDCVSTALTAAAIVTGRDVLDLGEWDGPETLRAALEDAGGPVALLESVAQQVGQRRSTTGDIVYVPGADDITGMGSLMVVVTDRLLVATIEDGVRLVPLGFPEGATCWRLNAS